MDQMISLYLRRVGFFDWPWEHEDDFWISLSWNLSPCVIGKSWLRGLKKKITFCFYGNLWKIKGVIAFINKPTYFSIIKMRS
jgi:hypothetical protein